MESRRVGNLLRYTGAIIEGHFVGTSGKHLSSYIRKDKAIRFTSIASEFCFEIAKRFIFANVDVVVAPAVGGVVLSTWTAHHLTQFCPGRPEILALYSERDETAIPYANSILGVKGNREVIIRHPRFVLNRGFDEDVRGKRILVVEDILTTGNSARLTVDAVRQAEGTVVGLGVLANCGNVTAEMCDVNRLEALTAVDRQIFTEKECAQFGLCAQGVPINTDFGHGKAFLARGKGQK